MKNIFNKLKGVSTFIKDISTELVNHNINETRAISFGKKFYYKGKEISTGKIIIDDENSKILIYETFVKQEERIICRPKIYIIDFKDLKRCKLLYKYEFIKEEELFHIMFKDAIKWNDICIEISSKKSDFYPFHFYSDLIGNYEKLIDIYTTLNKIVDQQKNSIRQYTIL